MVSFLAGAVQIDGVAGEIQAGSAKMLIDPERIGREGFVQDPCQADTPTGEFHREVKIADIAQAHQVIPHGAAHKVSLSGKGSSFNQSGKL